MAHFFYLSSAGTKARYGLSVSRSILLILAHDSPAESDMGYPMASWDVSRLTNMDHLFDATDAQCNATTMWFNEPLDGWDISRVRKMASMFRGAARFNQPLRNWDVSRAPPSSTLSCEERDRKKLS